MKGIHMTAGWLVVAAALTTGMTACSGDDRIIDEPNSTTTLAPKTCTLTIEATKGGASRDQSRAGSSFGEAQPALDEVKGGDTRALSLDDHTLNATWKTGEKVTVSLLTEVSMGGTTMSMPTKIGTLEAQSDGETTTLTGTIQTTGIEVTNPFAGTSETRNLAAGDKLEISFAGSLNDGSIHMQDGTLQTLADYFDKARAEVTVATVGATDVTINEGTAQFQNQRFIIRFSLVDKATGDPISPSELNIETTISGMGHSEPITIPDATYTTNGAGIVFATFPGDDTGYSGTVSLTATVGTGTYTYEKANVSFENGKYYEIKVKMKKATDLSKLTAGEYVAQDGEVLTGTLDGKTQKVKVCIAPGATVTLHDATIKGRDYDECLWAGINPLGNATIVLEGSNSVTSFNVDYPGIEAAHNDTGSGTEYTLTIQGSGSLTAINENYGAAIGTIWGETCGNISIEGGTIYAETGDGAAIGAGMSATCGSINISGGNITAIGGDNGAGIGCGNGYNATSACGDITITGGTITATGGGSGAGIGSGDTGTSGNITISGGTITATGGGNGAGIGTGNKGTCGNINFSGGTIMAVGGSGAAGIGTGYGDDGQKAVCGDISISRGGSFVSVKAIRGSAANRSIGPSQGDLGDGYKCGKIYFGGELVYDGEYDTYDMPDKPSYGNLKIEITTESDGDDDTVDTDNTWTLTPR